MLTIAKRIAMPLKSPLPAWTQHSGSLPEARDIVEELTAAEVKLNIGRSLHDPNDPIERLLFHVPAMIAQFESDLIKIRTRERMKVTKTKGRLQGKPPKLSPTQETHLVGRHQARQHP